MLFTDRRFRTVGLAAGGLTLIAAVGIATTDGPPSGKSTALGRSAPRGVLPNPVALNPAAGATDPRLHLTVPGRIVDGRSVRGPRARLLGETAGAVRVRGPQAAPAGRSADSGTVPAQQATLPGNTAGGGSDPGSEATGPGNTPTGGTALGAQVTVLGMVVGAQATVR